MQVWKANLSNFAVKTCGVFSRVDFGCSLFIYHVPGGQVCLCQGDRPREGEGEKREGEGEGEGEKRERGRERKREGERERGRERERERERESGEKREESWCVHVLFGCQMMEADGERDRGEEGGREEQNCVCDVSRQVRLSRAAQEHADGWSEREGDVTDFTR